MLFGCFLDAFWMLLVMIIVKKEEYFLENVDEVNIYGGGTHFGTTFEGIGFLASGNDIGQVEHGEDYKNNQSQDQIKCP
jgi:hypothetical protein